ncbi:MAG: hypothetical protein HRU01_13880 [Myxococcales bacterium]|nr:hypothetical protein [Myxococcales bacterium]
MEKRLALIFACLICSIGCSEAQDSDRSGRAAAPSASEPQTAPVKVAAKGKPWNQALGTATIAGSVNFSGTAPRARPIDMAGADQKCAEIHGGKRVKPDTVVVNDNGTLRNVFVWVKTGVEGWSFPMPEGDALLDQDGCLYEPHVQGMRTGQSLSIATSDPTAHNVHGYAKANRPFNRSQPAGAANVSIRMRRGESTPPMKVKCDIHPWMNAYVAVVDHPYFAVTGVDGSFELANLPPGTYTIATWHEKYDVIEQTITVGDQEARTLDFDYSG